MVSMESIKSELQERLSPKRYRHSLGVAEEARHLAERYGVDRDKAYLAGLVHDCAKEVPPLEATNLLRSRYSALPDAVMVQMPGLLHGPLGACIAQSDFGIYDPEILDAIRYHTTGKANMSLFAKIIYIADYIEPNRDYPDVDVLRKLTYEDIDRAILYGIDYTIGKLLQDGKVIHPDTVHCRNDLLIWQEKKRETREGETL
ncbi:MAG: bis(5'-nucleosyl)-tetraphosphatase (symmetrical) YqeK [Clostridia bacterium]|nr:bis(5'-nucleosyl)-tetraphosphatase (symmetrical) YqeK [Clostridia bacterium]